MNRRAVNGGARGYTLIELVILIVIVGVLAAAALPRYRDLSVDARVSACKGSLAAVREGISLYYARQVLLSGVGSYPDIDSLTHSDLVMRGAFPPNPFQIHAADSVVAGEYPGQIGGERGGWVYNPATGQFWANTSTVIPSAWLTPERQINENLF